MRSRMSFRGIGAVLTLFVGVGIGGPARAVPFDLAAVLTALGLPALSARQNTFAIGENSTEMSTGEFPFTSTNSGSLVLCEPGQLVTNAQGVGTGCTSNAQVSDILKFTNRSATATLLSETEGRPLDITNLGNIVKWVEEGTLRDDRPNVATPAGASVVKNLGTDLNPGIPDVTVFIRAPNTTPTGKTTAFIIFSDTAGGEAPEPASLALLASALLGLGLARRRTRNS